MVPMNLKYFDELCG